MTNMLPLSNPRNLLKFLTVFEYYKKGNIGAIAQPLQLVEPKGRFQHIAWQYKIINFNGMHSESSEVWKILIDP